MPIGSGVAHTGDAESGAEEGSAHEATLLERRAKATERQRRSRSNRKMIASSLAAMAAAPSTMCVVGANDRLVDGDTKPSASVHTCGATVVRDIITKDHFKVSDFEKLAPKMEGLFGEGVFKDYAKSTERSNRYSMQLLPRVKGPTPEDAPWMQAMVERVRDVLGPDGLKILGPQHQFGAMTLLLSDGRGQGACQQDWHCDYDWKAKVFNKYGKKLKHGGSVPYPVSVLIACHEEGASLPVKGAEVINFGQFSAVVFRGDLEHAGAAWRRRGLHAWNWRIHMYFETRGEDVPVCKTCRVPYRGRAGRDRQIVVCPCRTL